MSLLNKLTVKNLKLNKKRTIVTIIGIMLSVALITAVASIYSSGIASLIKYEGQIKGNYHIAFYGVDKKDLDIFKNNRNIESINIVNNIGYAKVDSKNEDKPYAFIKSFSKESLENLAINISKGRMPENDSEILIPTHLRTNGRLALDVGDEITLNVGKRIDSTGNELNQNNPYQGSVSTDNSEMLVNTTLKTYKIVGITTRPATGIEPYSAPGYTFITRLDESKMEDKIDVYVRYTRAGRKNMDKVTAGILGVDEELFTKLNAGMLSQEEYDTIMNQMNNTYLINVNSYLIGLENDPLSLTTVGGLGVVVIIVIGIIVFTSVFCIKNSFDISITEKIKQYGMLRSIGATKKQIKRNVFYEATILGVIGIPLGIALGFLASFILVNVSNYFLGGEFISGSGIKLEFSFSLLAVTVAIVLGILTVYFSAFRSARRASNVSPIDSIRNSADIKINSKKLKTPKIINKLFGIGGEISYKNLKRNKKKYRTTVISIIVSVFVFIALSGFMNLAMDLVENEIKYFDYNISLTVNGFSDESYKKIIGTTKLDNIDDYTIYRSTEFETIGCHYSKEYKEFFNMSCNDIEETYITVASIGEEQYKKYIKKLGYDYDYVKDKGILLDTGTEIMYDENNKKHSKYLKLYDFYEGDIIDGKFDNNDFNTQLQIACTTDIKPFGFKENDMPRMIIVSDEYFDKHTSTRFLSIYYKTSNANKLQDDIDNYLKGEQYNLNNKDENVKSMKNIFTLIGIFLYGFIIVISLIGITNIFNTITTNMSLRKREFATLKSVGMTSREFNRMIRLESIFMGVKALFFGIPIGILLSYLIYSFLEDGGGIPYRVPFLSVVISIVVVYLLISIIMKYSINKINKQNTIETIRNENI